MDALFHFEFVLIFLLAARVHIKHHFLAPLFFAVLAMFLDIDHFFGLSTRGSLHNVFVTIVFPLILVGLAFSFEKKGVFWKQFSIILLAVLFSHTLLDLSTNPAVKFLWPVSDAGFTLAWTGYAPVLASGYVLNLVSPLSISLLIAITAMIPIIFLEETVDFMWKKQETPKQAAKETFEEIRQKLREP
ncbi:MAG: hypothetical protein PHH08_01290 [Candidatus ainarchaeum sp.]|nr:hypothetical protein [Candidatus ainarchaeum sp.]